MDMAKYLDLTGLTHFWEGVKDYIDSKKANVVQTLTSGTNIGSVDGTTLYAPSGSTWYGTSSDTGATKTVACSGFSLTTGAIIGVFFSAQSAANPIKLNVNGTGAINVYIGDAVASATNFVHWNANTLVWFQYDGAHWLYMGASTSSSIQVPGGAGSYYAVSSTASDVAAKSTGTVLSYDLKPSSMVSVNFTNANTVTGALTLALGIGALNTKQVWVNNEATSATNPLLWNAGDTLLFVWTGDHYEYLTGSSQSGGGAYTLPPATASTLGGVKVGSGLSVASDGTLSASGGGGTVDPWFDPGIRVGPVDNTMQVAGTQESDPNSTTYADVNTLTILASHDEGENTESAEVMVVAQGVEVGPAYIDVRAIDSEGGSVISLNADKYEVSNPSEFVDALGWKVETKNSWRVETLPSGEKIATRTITGSLACTQSYGGRYISALQNIALPTGVFTTVDYAHVAVYSSPGLFDSAMTNVAATGNLSYYVVASSSLTQNVTRRLIVRGH